MAENINIAGRLHSTATGNVVAGANEIYDDTKGKKQSVVNQETDASLADRYTKAETYNKSELNNMITTPNQQYVTVTATDQTTAATDVLPATGAANTVYRVGNWDGSQFDASVYSEYAWDGSQYVHLSTKTKVGEVFDISAYHATGGTLATYADLSAALDSNNGGGVPQSLQKGGMSIKYVHTYDNKYVQARCMAQNFTTDVTQWQGIDEKPLANSKNLVESGGVYNEITPKHSDSDFSISDDEGNNIVDFNGGHIKTKEFDSSENATPSKRGLMSGADKTKLNGIEEGAQVNDTATESGSANLSFSDEEGNNIVDFKHGHVKTKYFDSENPVIKEAYSHNDLSFVDEDNNSVVEFNKGHVKTKNFDSANLPVKDEYSNKDLEFSDNLGNNVLEINKGNIKTQHFNSEYFGYDKHIKITAIADAQVSTKIQNGEYGLSSATGQLFTKVNGNLTEVTELLNEHNIFTLPGDDKSYYVWNGRMFTSIQTSFLNAIHKIPYMQFIVDTQLKNIHSLYEMIDFSSTSTMTEQIYTLFDALVANSGGYITKVDAVTTVGLTYPEYCRLGGQASGDYLATPDYNINMYKLEGHDENLGNNNTWNAKRKIFLVGGLHGNEYISPFNLYMLAYHLCNDFLEDENFFKLRGTFDFYIIPCLNGYGQYHNMRANGNKVNINRNFPVPNWTESGIETKDSAQGNNYTGPSAASEVETQLVMRWYDLIKPEIFIDNHNYGTETKQAYCSILTTRWYPLAGMAEIYAAYAFKKAYPQYFGNNFNGLIYGIGNSPRTYNYPLGKVPGQAGHYFEWYNQKNFSCTIEYPPYIRTLNGVWTGNQEVPDYSEDVLRLDEYLMRMHLLVIANTVLQLNS